MGEIHKGSLLKQQLHTRGVNAVTSLQYFHIFLCHNRERAYWTEDHGVAQILS